jgi:site-specific DNA-methyltransferase (adenine-specific)
MGPSRKARRPTARPLRIQCVDSQPPLSQEEFDGLVRELKVRNTDSLDNAIRQGEIFIRLNLPYDQVKRKTGITYQTADRKKRLATDPLMKLLRWRKPNLWTSCSLMLEWSDKYEGDMFRAMMDDPSVNNELVTPTQLKQWRSRYLRRKFVAEQKEQPMIIRPSECSLVNVVTCGNSSVLIERIPDNFVDMALFSPPFVEQRSGFYPGVPEEVYAEFFLTLMKLMWSKLKKGGSVLVVIRANVGGGRVRPWVVDTRYRMIHETEWIEPGEMNWHKPDAPPQGSNYILKATWEHILWYAKSGERPYIDRKACGRPSDRIGFVGSERFGIYKSQSEQVEGIANLPDLIVANVGSIDRGVDHPAMYPPTLVDQLVRTFCPEGGMVFDPFVGSGTTALVAKKLKRDFIAFDIMQEYVDLANARLAEDE